MGFQYYLGIAGEQTGPFTEEELRAKIRSAEVPQDALVWHEALDDWKPIRAVPELWAHFEGVGPTKPPPGKRKKKPKAVLLDDGELDAIATFATSDTALEPAFRAGGKPSKKKGGVSLGGGNLAKRLPLFLLLIVALGAGGFFIVSGGDLGFGDADTTASSAPSNGASEGWSVGQVAKWLGLGDFADMLGFSTTPEPVANAPANPSDERQSKLRKAQSNIMVNPEGALAELRALIDAKSDDEVARAAADAAVNYLQSVRRYGEAGKLLLQTNRPAEAVPLFLETPPSFEDADTAMLAAADASKDEERRRWIVKSIDLLLEANADSKKVEERVRMLERDFPASEHPYRYYLKSDDEKIADLFNRLSFAFVQSLLQFVATEFPQLSLQSRPTVSVVRESADRYRLVGRYSGPVQLSRDVLPSVTFVFWGHGGVWYLVETNVTEDRRRFAVAERKRRQKATLFTASELLSYLEGMFRNRYPGALLHESLEAAEKRRATASE